MIGGIIGLILVYLGTLIVRNYYDFNIYLNPGNILMGIIISTVVGIIAGLFPAVMASRLDPVKAMASTF
jgi:putative ABC transport system permease protein